MFVPGAVALWTALACLLASTYFYLRAGRGDSKAKEIARQTYVLGTFAVVLAAGIMLYLLVSHDFRVSYVYSYSDRSLPGHYLVSAFWAGQEGSFLFWLLVGMLIGLPLIRYARDYEIPVLTVYNLTQIALVVILLRQSPFGFIPGVAAGQSPADGQGLNPLLQNPWMTIHPPIMFIGYAATAVPFAFAIAGLWLKRFDEWVTVSLPWALLAVVTLGAAIALGGYWAYVTLGWGGYWGWDPVENSSLVPWLASAALLHGMLLQKARQRFRRLNLSLAILAYLLVVYATFLTRSGVLADFSVHSFVDLGITGWLVAYLAVFLLMGVGTLVWRWRQVPVTAGTEPLWSRTLLTVLGIATLLTAAITVLIGTSAPLFTRYFMTTPAQLGPPFYNQVTLPIGILMALLLVAAPLLGWQGGGRKGLLVLPGIAAVAVAGVAAAMGARQVSYIALMAVGTAAFVTAAWRLVDRLRQGEIIRAGAPVAHAGLALMLVGIVISSGYDRSSKTTLVKGLPVSVLGFELTFTGVEVSPRGTERTVLVGVTSPTGHHWVARPRLVENTTTKQLVANPDVHVGLAKDIYVSPVELEAGQPGQTGAPLEIGKGQTQQLGDLGIVFDGFDMQGNHGEAGGMAIGVRLSVTKGGQTAKLTPVLGMGPDGLASKALPIPQVGGATVQVTAIDADRGRVRLVVAGLPGFPNQAGTPERFTMDLTVKPLIGLVWLGMVLLTLGTALAVGRRWRPSVSDSGEKNGLLGNDPDDSLKD